MAGTAPGPGAPQCPSIHGRTATATPDGAPGAAPRLLPRGATLGRYVVLDCLGAGGMGVVYRAHDFALDRRVSLKLLRAAGADAVGRRERLVAEAQALARVSHPNVLAVHDVGTWEDEVYLALELVEGETVADWLARAPRSPAEIRGVFAQAARGLQALHDAGLVHRDVKPDNLLVGRDGRVRVADLGLAVSAGGEASAAEPGAPRPGTPGYMSLEQHRGEPLDGRADQFSLAVALHEALLGRRPYGSRGAAREALEERLSTGVPAPVPRSAGLPPRLRAALAQALEPDRTRRAPSLHPLLRALESPGLSLEPRVALPAVATAALALLLVPAFAAPPAAAWSSAEPLSAAPGVDVPLDVEAAVPLEPRHAAAPSVPGAPGSTPQGPSAEHAAVTLAPASTPAGALSPAVLTIGARQAPAPTVGASPGWLSHALDAPRLAELKALVETLLRAAQVTTAGPAIAALAPASLAASPAPGSTAGTSGSGGSPVLFAQAGSGGSGPAQEWTDTAADDIAAIERRLQLQIAQRGPKSEIAETRFALAQTLWDSSDASETQTRALALARQSQDDLRDANEPDVEDLRDTVTAWIDSRLGPVEKPTRGRAIAGPTRNARRDLVDP